MKVYAITYYDGDSDVTIKIFGKKKSAEQYVSRKNKLQPMTKHSGGPYYSLVEWKVE